MNQKLLIMLFLFFTIKAGATTWFDIEVNDPISGESTKVSEFGSYGSYIYNWDSKYDAIYWPLTAEEHIRFNTNSGYIAFGTDFEKITNNEIQKVKAYLSANYDSKTIPQSHIEKLQWLEKVYSQRETNKIFFIRYYCLLSYLHRNDKEKSSQYRKAALEKIENYLITAKPSFYRSQLYIVAGFYAKLLGDDKKAVQYWESPERLTVDKETTKAAQKYLESILESIKSEKYKKEYYR